MQPRHGLWYVCEAYAEGVVITGVCRVGGWNGSGVGAGRLGRPGAREACAGVGKEWGWASEQEVDVAVVLGVV